MNEAEVVAEIANELGVDEEHIAQWRKRELKVAPATVERIRGLLGEFETSGLFQ